MDGSRSGSINGMDISPDGSIMVTGGDDKLIKVREKLLLHIQSLFKLLKSQNLASKIAVGQVVFELLIETCKMLPDQ